MGALIGTGCISDPEARSGADAYRHQAETMSMDEWEVGDIAARGGDRTDWRAVDLAVPGRLTVTARVDETDTELLIGIYDRYGRPLHVVQASAGQGELKAMAKVVRAGRVFIMVQATGGPPSAYNLRATLGDGDDSSSPRPGF